MPQMRIPSCRDIDLAFSTQLVMKAGESLPYRKHEIHAFAETSKCVLRVGRGRVRGLETKGLASIGGERMSKLLLLTLPVPAQRNATHKNCAP